MGYNLLGDQILPEFGQRPNAHADQGLGRRKGNLTNLLHDVGQKFSRTGATTIIWIPRNGLDSSLIKSVNDLANPSATAVATFGNSAIGAAAAREQDNPGVSAIDSVGQLVFHTFKLSTFPRLKLPCYYLRHNWFSTNVPADPSAVVENLYILYVVVAQVLYLEILTIVIRNAKLCYWKRH